MACINININIDVNRCLSELRTSLKLLVRPKSGIQKLEKEMARLRGKRDDIKYQIDLMEREGEIPIDEWIQWLREMEELEGQVAAIKQDFQSMSCFSCHCFNRAGGTSSQTQQAESSNFYSIILRMAKKLIEANELMSLTGAPVPIARFRPRRFTTRLPIPHLPPVGIDSYLNDIVGYIDGGEGNTIGIYGMGGVGKTTILMSIQQHYLLEDTIFDRVIWVVASQNCQLKRLQMDIAMGLGLKTLKESDDEQTCGDKLFSYLKNKACLLLLDDIWEHLDLQLLGMTHSATEQSQQQQQQKQPRKVVVFTTRDKAKCEQMNAEKKIKVECLNPDQAWQLFEQNSDGDVLSSDAGIKFLAEELAKECAGLPLALVTVARAMSGKRSWEAWKEALHQIRDKHVSTPIGLPEESLPMYKSFKSSYDSLENDLIRECLLCCVLWPKDYDIHKFDELIPCWIGCGIINDFNVINEAFHKGCYYLETLIAASLLEDSRRQSYYKAEHVKMPNSIRDMVLLMVSELKGNGRKWIVKAGIELSHLPSQEEWQEAERASFMRNNITSLQDYEASTFSKLCILILHGNHLSEIPPTLLTNMPLLTCLNLSLNFGIEELPKEIGSLTKLQYLNLSSTDIKSLPLEFGCLKKLEYLLLRNTRIKTIPNEIMSNLSMLKWLDIGGYFPVCDSWLNELKCLREEHHKISLGITINPANFEILNMLPNVSVWNLTVSGSESSKFSVHNLGTLKWSHRISDNLECLTILDVPGDELAINAGVDCESSFGCLKTLYFRRLGKLKNIRWNGVGFNNLHDLYISDCYMLKDVSWVLQLPCLDFLRISNCWEMEELISNVGNFNSSFGIKMLILFQMNNLHRISHQPLHFPNLKNINVCHCPRLKKLPFGTGILRSGLKEIIGDQTWWDSLDWDDNSNRDSLTTLFRNQLD
ncbi:probable disease resistance protein At1g61300 [Zingiber officinale]|uniref:probable disease resistance protein At1g61300 n=1 Tax=Zingiber officinale TaxID=94328 RepID=UPI001C4C169F|nr:probable disease resistance protein At1g61300 [Zingiber officinale]